MSNPSTVQAKDTHRQIATLKANGCSHKEIAIAIDQKEQFVDSVVNLPFFNSLLLSALANAGDVTSTFLEAQVEPAIKKIVKLMNTANSETVQLKACNDLLDRHLGKPILHVKSEHVGNKLKEAQKRMPDLDKRINDISKQLETRGHGLPSQN